MQYGDCVSGHFFEDFRTGDRLQSATFSVTSDAIVQFSREFDPQVFHLNSQSPERSLLRGLVASGWHTAAISMRLFVDTMNVPGGIVGLGIDELRWPNPVRPGDELRLEIEIIETRLSKSRPGNGIIRIRNVTRNQQDQVVQSFQASAMLPMRRIP